MILTESIGVGLLACMVGSPLGFALANLTTAWSYTNRFIQPVFDGTPILGAIVVGVVLSILGGLAPAWRAARISPVEALRYE
jgi:ABC-type antimicrobial peptide transport system permease subunit